MNEKLREQLKQWYDSGKETLAADAAPESINEEQRTVDAVFFTGIEVPRYDWRRDEPYTLRFDPKGADLSLLQNGAPVCDSHMSWSLQRQLGRVEKAWAEGKKYLATLRFSKRPEVDGIWQDVKDKIVTKLSMGVEILEIEEMARKEGAPLIKLATKWRPFELSLVPVPADFGTAILRAETSRPAPAGAVLGARLREVEVLRLRG